MAAVVQGLAMVSFLVLGWRYPRVPGIPLINRDVISNLVNGVLLFALRVTVVAAVAQQAELGLIDAGGWPLWAQLLVGFVVLDLTRYWVHYADHRVPWLWNFHRVHHSAERMDATTGLRMHLVDFVQLSAIPIVLFVVVIDTSAWSAWVLPAILAVGAVMDAFQHSNLRVDTSRPLFKVWNLLLNNPHFHSWHHTRDGHLRDGNYSNTLIIWDRIFGTEVTGPETPEAFGITASESLVNDPLSWQLLRHRPAQVVDGEAAS
jgi:sterol desaturase/sphingolipid hydroxylase (fatty acid hydroxylase superfamily)